MTTSHSDISYFFRKPEEIPEQISEQIYGLIVRCGGVGTKWVKSNLKNAFLVGYAMDAGRLVGACVHKKPPESYRKKIEAATGLDLSEYLERGYTSVDPEYRSRDIADGLIKGLIRRSEGKKIYVTIRMNNPHPLRLTYKNNMTLAATFIHPITGNVLGVFTNQGRPENLAPAG